MFHQNQGLFSTGKGRGWHFLDALGPVFGTSNIGSPSLLLTAWCHEHSWFCFTKRKQDLQEVKDPVHLIPRHPFPCNWISGRSDTRVLPHWQHRSAGVVKKQGCACSAGSGHESCICVELCKCSNVLKQSAWRFQGRGVHVEHTSEC